MSRVYPGLAVLLVLTLAGCGGGSDGGGTTGAAASQAVRGNGYAFSAPSSWKVRQSPISSLAAPAGDQVTLVGVYRLRTAKPYRPSLWPAAAAELDRKAAVLAAELHGRLASKSTTAVAGGRARQYDFAYGDKRARITFFYRRTNEYELYCRWKASEAEPSACKLLLTSFRPA